MPRDYTELLPDYLLVSSMLKDYVNAVGGQVDTISSSVGGIPALLSPRTVPVGSIQRLADLVGLDLYGVDVWPEYRLRNQLIQAVDYYRIKGTYQSLIDTAYLFGLPIYIEDFWVQTNVNPVVQAANYANQLFTPESWFVSDNGTVPSDLDSSYYKTTHFGVYFLLNVVKTDITDFNQIALWEDPAVAWDDATYLWGGRSYLWNGLGVVDFVAFIEKIRPVNTVPHYYTLLQPVTRENGAVESVQGNIQTVITSNWTYSTILFDDNIQFDDSSTRFDNSASVFFASITNWRLGNGHKGASPTFYGFSLSDTVLSGTIASLVTTATYYEFRITVPQGTVQPGVSELGLYIGADTSTPVLFSTFPDIDIGLEATLQINVRVYKDTLPS